ncbi:Uu.00g139690.m01.CDS01 [Anthostomella pinea]|uniref:Uu.00g139690.m01.CDS01 n=1 Tax=Anthostomella pinea TaxID=933095 RepID=A0AAI8YL68_9PEZI|nr:Uu.00g139690.m01.CDS01 [Anthostomella pinea]
MKLEISRRHKILYPNYTYQPKQIKNDDEEPKKASKSDTSTKAKNAAISDEDLHTEIVMPAYDHEDMTNKVTAEYNTYIIDPSGYEESAELDSMTVRGLNDHLDGCLQSSPTVTSITGLRACFRVCIHFRGETRDSRLEYMLVLFRIRRGGRALPFHPRPEAEDHCHLGQQGTALRATRDIRKGEKITISYIPRDDSHAASQVKRLQAEHGGPRGQVDAMMRKMQQLQQGDMDLGNGNQSFHGKPAGSRSGNEAVAESNPVDYEASIDLNAITRRQMAAVISAYRYDVL